MNSAEIERIIGRQLTESERRTIAWLNGWEQETVGNVMALILSARTHGAKRGNRDD